MLTAGLSNAIRLSKVFYCYLHKFGLIARLTVVQNTAEFHLGTGMWHVIRENLQPEAFTKND